MKFLVQIMTYFRALVIPQDGWREVHTLWYEGEWALSKHHRFFYSSRFISVTFIGIAWYLYKGEELGGSPQVEPQEEEAKKGGWREFWFYWLRPSLIFVHLLLLLLLLLGHLLPNCLQTAKPGQVMNCFQCSTLWIKVRKCIIPGF